MSKDKILDVKVVDSAIIVSLLSDGEKKLWRADLSQMPTASFSVKEGLGKYSVMITNGASQEEILSCADKKKANAALETLTEEMMRFHSGAHRSHGSWFVGFLKFVFFLLILAVLGLMLMPRQPGQHRIKESAVISTPAPDMPAPPMPEPEPMPAPEPVSPVPTTPPAGVPVPADDILGR